MKKTIAVIANSSWYLFNFRLRLMLELQMDDYSVIAIAPEDSYSKLLEENGIRFIPCHLNRRGKNPFFELYSLLKLFLLFNKIRPTLILSSTPKTNIYSSIVSRLAGIPVLCNVSGLGYAFIRQGLLTKIVTAMYRFSFARTAKVFFENDDDLSLFIQKRIVTSSVAERIPGLGVDTSRFVPSQIQRIKEPFVFLLVARMLWDKGIGEYVEAAINIRQKYPDTIFQLLGPIDVGNPSSISETKIMEWIAGGVIEYLGATDSVIEFLAKADCVVLPSYREGCPRSLLEAASMAKPIITTDTPGCRDVVDNGKSGLLCKPQDADDLAEKMGQMLLLSEAGRLKIGQCGREKMIREFDEQIVLDRYIEVVRVIIA